MSFPRYSAYKDSGVVWLGEVPEHWEVKRLGFLCSKIGSGKTPLGGAETYLSDGILFIRSQNVYDGGLLLDDAVYISDEADAEQSWSRVLPGDVLLNITGASLGRTCLVADDFQSANVNQHVCILRLTNTAPRHYVSMALKSSGMKSQFEAAQNGAAREGLNFAQIAKLMLAIPTPKEQTSISAFLDRETAKIDTLITEQQRLIELLQEKKQAFISHAVTKGLNPNAPKKDSGVEWLGEVPEHWNLLRGRFLYTKREEVTQNSDEVVTAFRDGQVIQRNLRRVDGFTLAELEVGYQHVCIGDLVIHGMDAFAGAIGVSESEGKCTPEYSVCYPIDSSHSNTYFAHALRVMARREYIYVICPSVRERAPRFRFNTFKDVVLPVPPSSEQESISKSITYECSRLSELVSSAEALMAVLKERRSALISAAVTGQIDVRGLLEAEAGEQ